jgi:hypothetical protein
MPGDGVPVGLLVGTVGVLDDGGVDVGVFFGGGVGVGFLPAFCIDAF